MCADFVYLASGSPRRRELLAQIGVPFRVIAVTVDEVRVPGEAPDAYVARLAREKAQAGLRAKPDGDSSPVLAADTTVVLDGNLLAKPGNSVEGERMLLDLSGRTHQVLTAVAVATTQGLIFRSSCSEVTFRPINADEARDYWATGEPHDKAGGYAIQGGAAIFIADLRGSYSGVMGLPLFETAQLLQQAGVPHWSYPR